MEHAQGVEQPPAPVAAPAASARRRKQYEDEALTRSVARVVEGGEKAALVSREAGIPYRTLAKYVRRARAGQSLARRRTGPPPVLAASGERALLDWMRSLQRRGLPVRRRELMARANELAREGGAAEQLSAGWYKRFRQRHPEISGSSADLVVGGDEEREQAELEQETTTGEHETQSEDDDGEQQAPSTAELQQQQQQPQQQQPQQQQPQQQQQQQQPEQQLPRLRLEELSPMERAVLVVQDQYAGRMPAADVVDAFDVMLDPVKARVFLVMTAGDGRDLWLRKQVARSRQEASTS